MSRVLGLLSAGVAGGLGLYAAVTHNHKSKAQQLTKTTTINRVLVEVQSLWEGWNDDGSRLRELGSDPVVDFRLAPGDRGTELVVRVSSPEPGAQHALDDEVRRFKQFAETGEVVRSDGAPVGKRALAQFPQHPARPLTSDELAEVGSV